MKRKMTVFLIACLSCLCLTSCKNKHDAVVIRNKGAEAFDNIVIEVKDGYFYDRHEKFVVDENTIGLTIYFSADDGSWE